MTRKVLTVLAVTAPFLAAYAGGWATVTVENLPEYFVAGQPTNITFAVRQHGHDLLGNLAPAIEAKSGDTEKVFRAVATNRNGYYTATVTAPATGNWNLKIRSGFGTYSDVKLMPIPAFTSNARPVALSASDRGQRLFVAKGCVSCHMNARTPDSGQKGWESNSPDLTNRPMPTEYLQQFLANPAIKTKVMPNLELKPDEITALIAFINANAPRDKVTAGQ